MFIRTIPLVLAAATAMALAAPATAKVIEEAAVCGADGCKAISTKGDAHVLLEGGAITDAPKQSPFYRLRFAVGDGTGKVFERFTIVYVPSAHKIRAMDGSWVETTTAGDRALRRAVRGHQALPASKMKTGVSSDAERFGTSLPPEVVSPPTDPPAAPADDGGLPAWLIVLAASCGLALAGGGAAWALRRRPGGGEAAVAP